jgi:hypothetical protein
MNPLYPLALSLGLSSPQVNIVTMIACVAIYGIFITRK